MSRYSTSLLVLCCMSFLVMATEPVSVPAPATDPPIRKLDGHLVDIKGRGLYTWDGDKTPGRSLCNAQCRILWPPIFADVGAKPKGQFTLAQRDDGTQQWALRGKPLYRWASDKNYGDAGGDGVSVVWHLVKIAPPAAPKPAPDAVVKPTEAAKSPESK